MMRIASAQVFTQSQPFVDGSYVCRGHSESGFVSTIVALIAENGVVGWGEAAPLGAFYADGFPEGILAGVKVLLPEIIGLDACAPVRLADRLDHKMTGQPAAKSAIDMAAWDLAARLANQPLANLLGGIADGDIALYRSISQSDADTMASKAAALVKDGYRRLQVKVGDDPIEDAQRMRSVRDAVPPDIPLYADANGAWKVEQALRFLAATPDLDYRLEQPCMRYADNLKVARQCPQPFILDEGIGRLDDLLRASADGIISGVTLKTARIGGIGKTRLIRDVAIGLDLVVTVEDTGGSTINTAATAHMMASIPARNRGHTVDFMNWVTVANATRMPSTRMGCLVMPEGPGLGIDVTEEVLDPVSGF